MNFLLLLLLHQYLQPHQSLSNMAEMNNSIYSQMKQDLAIKIHEHEDEITRLRNRLADYSIKEARIRLENTVLEKRIEDMHLGYVEQHQEMVDAESRALSYRQGVIEENIRLTYALQDVQEERSMYISTIMNLLEEYSLQPSAQDALSMVSKVKVLFKHLQEQLIRIENKDGLELVPQSGSDRDIPGRHWSGFGGNGDAAEDVVDADELERRRTRTNSTHGIATKPIIKQGEEKAKKEVKFREPGNNSEVVGDPDGDGNHQNGEQTSAHGSSDADDDPLPAIEDLQILGEAVPGRELQACGFSINGATICNFEWIRHLEDGSLNFIEGAVQPNYLVTADDVDTYLAIEVLPLDDRNRKGEPVKVFANDKKKIACDPEAVSYIEKTLYSGHASYEVSLSTGYLDIWEPATLAIKREGYGIKCSGPRGVVVAEKFSPSINVMIPYGSVSEFIIICSSGVELLLRAENKSTDVSGFRDTIVLTLRLFILRVGEKRRGKKGLFFNK